MPDLLSFPFVVAAVVAVVAGMVRGFAGFGAAMVMTPVFSALHGPAVGVAICLLLAGAAVGVPFGTLVLTASEPRAMRWAISAIVLLAVVLLASGWRYGGRPHAATTLSAGASSGFLNGLAGMAGPPIAFYYLAGADSVTRVRANLTTYFVFVDLVALSAFVARDLVSRDTAVTAACLAPAVMLGGVLGGLLFPLASEGFYRRLALVLLTGVAIGSLIL